MSNPKADICLSTPTSPFPMGSLYSWTALRAGDLPQPMPAAGRTGKAWDKTGKCSGTAQDWREAAEFISVAALWRGWRHTARHDATTSFLLCPVDLKINFTIVVKGTG